MAKKTEAQPADLEDQIEPGPDDSDFDDDGMADALRKVLEAPDGDAEGGFDQPFEDADAPDLDVVSPDKGQSMVEDAQLKRERAAADEKKGKAAASDDDADDGAAKDAEDAPADKADKAEPAADPTDLSAASVADLVKDVPEAQRAELTRRLGEMEKVNALFAGRDEELRMHGLSGPSEVISRLLHLNAYAQQKPDEYIAWVARETRGDKAHEILGAAAEKLGYKVVPAEDSDDDDPFLSDRERELAAEVKRLKAAQQQAPDFGPMAPAQLAQQQALQVITALRTELDPATGAAKRPYWGNVEHLIARRASAHRQSVQAPPTAADLARFYDESVAELMQTFGAGGNSAAQPSQGVAQPNATTAANTSTDRSRAASKMIDGAGQGASRPPALSESASIEQVIRHAIAQQER